MWVNPPANLNLSGTEAHIWKLDSKNLATSTIHSLSNYLNLEELGRAKKFRFEKDSITFIAGRAALRMLISQYLKLKPSEVEFNFNAQGKPFLKDKNSLSFNISHSNGMIVFGFVRNTEVGIDIEYNKKHIEIEKVANSFFAPAEVADLMSLPSELRLEAFYNCWTRKEAFIKAKGGGLSIPLDQFEVSLLPNEKPLIKSVKWNLGEEKQWFFKTATLAEDYTMAVLIERDYDQVKWMEAANWLKNQLSEPTVGE